MLINNERRFPPLQVFIDNQKVIYSKDKRVLLLARDKNINKYIIPDNVVEIRKEAFRNCKQLQSIIMADSISKIGENAFNNCSSLESVKLPNKLLIFEKNTFSNCTALTSITIPKKTAKICNEAFSNCPSFKILKIANFHIKIEENAFDESILPLPNSYLDNSGITNIYSNMQEIAYNMLASNNPLCNSLNTKDYPCNDDSIIQIYFDNKYKS